MLKTTTVCSRKRLENLLRRIKSMKKRLFTLMLVMTLLFVTSNKTIVYANELTLDMATFAIQCQANEIIASIDEDVLLIDALNDVVDYDVPESIREGVVGEAIFVPAEGVSEDDYVITAHTTVQKVGEIMQRSGETSNMYVAVVATEVKEDWNMNYDTGVRAWAFVYWIDNLGTNNELYSAKGTWDPGDAVVSNRVVKYGVSDPTGLMWLEGPTVQTTTENIAEFVDPGVYYGYKLKCQALIDIANIGTLTASVTSHWLT